MWSTCEYCQEIVVKKNDKWIHLETDDEACNLTATPDHQKRTVEWDHLGCSNETYGFMDCTKCDHSPGSEDCEKERKKFNLEFVELKK